MAIDCDDPPLHFGHASFAIGAVGQLQQQAAPLMTAMEPKHVAMQKETDSLSLSALSYVID